jgi:hypothetical protein
MNAAEFLIANGLDPAFVARLLIEEDDPFNEANRHRHQPDVSIYPDGRRGTLIAATANLSHSRRVEAPVNFVGYCLDAPERIPTGTAHGARYYYRGEA